MSICVAIGQTVAEVAEVWRFFNFQDGGCDGGQLAFHVIFAVALSCCSHVSGKTEVDVFALQQLYRVVHPARHCAVHVGKQNCQS